MPDIVDAKTRSRMMSGIRAKDTRPEMIVRRGLHKKGFRYRIHDKNLTSKPDLHFPKHKAVIFVHGCYWHFHGCNLSKLPSSNRSFWKKKFEANEARDQRAIKNIEKANLRHLVIWECSMRGSQKIGEVAVIDKAEKWLLSDKQSGEISGTAQ